MGVPQIMKPDSGQIRLGEHLPPGVREATWLDRPSILSRIQESSVILADAEPK
jgi:hypothetical protein